MRQSEEAGKSNTYINLLLFHSIALSHSLSLYLSIYLIYYVLKCHQNYYSQVLIRVFRRLAPLNGSRLSMLATCDRVLELKVRLLEAVPVISQLYHFLYQLEFDASISLQLCNLTCNQLDSIV